MIISVLNFLHHSHTVLEADLAGSSHFSVGSLAHTVKNLMKHINLLLTERIFKGDTKPVELVREFGGVNLTLTDNSLYSLLVILIPFL